MDLIIVTGLSGAGKSTVISALEDIGYFCVDNLPVRLIPTLSKAIDEQNDKRRLAVVSDVRAGITPDDMKDTLTELDEMKINYKVLFIDCNADVILNRFKLSRRAHPLCDDCIRLIDATSMENKLMEKFRQMADYIIDTTHLDRNSLKKRIFEFFGEPDSASGGNVKLHIVSFGFKHGVPMDADYIFDVRSLPNPYYVEELKELTGLDERVSSFVMSFPESKEYEKKLIDFCDFVVPLCTNDGRSQLVIAIGCTGGHHRSVAFAEGLYKHYKALGCSVSVIHRDVNK